MMDKETIFLIKHTKKNSTVVACFIIAIGLIMLVKKTYLDQAFLIMILFIFLLILTVAALITEMTNRKKDYFYLIDRTRKVLCIDFNWRHKGEISFSEIKGIAIGKQKVKSSSIHYLQLFLSPKAWNEFNQVKSQKASDNTNYYEEMYLTFLISNSQIHEVEQLINFAVKSGLERRIFAPQGIGNSVPGKQKTNYHQRLDKGESPILVKQRRKQIINYFCLTSFTLVAIISLIIKILGMFFGIFW